MVKSKYHRSFIVANNLSLSIGPSLLGGSFVVVGTSSSLNVFSPHHYCVISRERINSCVLDIYGVQIFVIQSAHFGLG